MDTLHRFFPSFRLDARNAQLWGDDHEIGLRRKTVDVLLYLVDHSGQTAQCERLTRNPFVDRVQEDPTACFPSKGFFAQVQSEFYWTKGQWTKGPFHNAMQERIFRFTNICAGRGNFDAAEPPKLPECTLHDGALRKAGSHRSRSVAQP